MLFSLLKLTKESGQKAPLLSATRRTPAPGARCFHAGRASAVVFGSSNAVWAVNRHPPVNRGIEAT